MDGVDLTLPEEEVRRAMAEAIATFAAEHDFDIVADDILVADAEAVEGELTEAELESVAGGRCFCVFIGAAKGCGCVFYGFHREEDSPFCYGIGYGYGQKDESMC